MKDQDFNFWPTPLYLLLNNGGYKRLTYLAKTILSFAKVLRCFITQSRAVNVNRLAVIISFNCNGHEINIKLLNSLLKKYTTASKLLLCKQKKKKSNTPTDVQARCLRLLRS